MDIELYKEYVTLIFKLYKISELRSKLNKKYDVDTQLTEVDFEIVSSYGNYINDHKTSDDIRENIKKLESDINKIITVFEKTTNESFSSLCKRYHINI